MMFYVRIASLILMVATTTGSVYFNWQIHKLRKAQAESVTHCLRAHQDMTLAPGQCVFIEIPIPYPDQMQEPDVNPLTGDKL